MDILIIEDEKLAAKRLSELLTAIDDTINIVGVVDSIEQGVDWFLVNQSPDLVFADIELADGISFEIFKRAKITCPIIFCTAYNHYMIEAFDTNAVSYILKPISREQVEKAMDQYHAMKSIFSSSDLISSNPNNIEGLLKLINSDVKSYKSTLTVNQGERIIPIGVSDIAYIYATSSEMVITMINGKEYAYNSTLDDITRILNPNDFYRANRQFVISRNAIKAIERYFNRKLVVKLSLKTPEQLLVSRLKAKEFMEWVEM